MIKYTIYLLFKRLYTQARSLSLTYLDLRDLAGEGAVGGGAGEEDDDELPEEQEEVHLQRNSQYNDSN